MLSDQLMDNRACVRKLKVNSPEQDGMRLFANLDVFRRKVVPVVHLRLMLMPYSLGTRIRVVKKDATLNHPCCLKQALHSISLEK